MALNDPQDDLLDLIRQACANAVKNKTAAIKCKKVGFGLVPNTDHTDEVFKLSVKVSGHDLWALGLNEEHPGRKCSRCAKENDHPEDTLLDDLLCYDPPKDK